MSDPIVKAARLELASALRSDRVDLVAAMVDHIKSDVYEYGEVVPDEVIEQLAQHVDSHLRVYIDLLELAENDVLDESRFEFAYDAARLRARQGVSSESLIRSFSSATSRLWDWLIDHEWEDHDRETVMRYGWPTWFEYINEAAARVTAVYRQIELEQFEDDLAARSAFVTNLIERHLSDTEARRMLREFGISRTTGLVVAVLGTGTSSVADDDVLRQIGRVVTSRLEGLTGVRPLLAVRDAEIVVLIDPSRFEPTRLRQEIALAVGRFRRQAPEVSGVISYPMNNLLQVSEAYATGYRALQVVAQDPRVILTTDVSILDYAVAALGSDIARVCPPDVAGFLRTADEDHPDWLDTIEVWATNSMNAKKTAQYMHVHVNTIYYRLDRLAQATGINPNSLRDVASLAIAARLRRHLRVIPDQPSFG